MNTKLSLLVIAYCCYLVQARDVNQPCNSDLDCQDTKLSCVQGICNCKSGYRHTGWTSTPESGTTADCQFVIGSSCNNSDECKGVDGAICENSKCICQAGLLPNTDSVKCVGPIVLGKGCSILAECLPSGGDNAECKENICVCKPGFHGDLRSKCIKDKVLGEFCEQDNECYQEINGNNVLTCTTENLCNCTSGYTAVNNECSGSKRVAVMSLLGVLFFAFALLKFN